MRDKILSNASETKKFIQNMFSIQINKMFTKFFVVIVLVLFLNFNPALSNYTENLYVNLTRILPQDQRLCRLREFTTDMGVITSPDYPNQYDHGINCGYKITVSPGKKIIAEFQAMDTEFNYDFVEFYDGSSPYVTSLGKYSGSTLPRPVYSSSNNLYIRFNSDVSGTGTGWKLTYRTVDVLG